MSILGGGILAGVGGGTRFHEAFVGVFTATTVVQRAFKEGDLIGFEAGGRAPIGYLAPVDIPVGSPAPGARGALWISFGGSFAGVDRATLDSLLATYATSAALAGVRSALLSDISDADDKADAARQSAQTAIDGLAGKADATEFATVRAEFESSINTNTNNIGANRGGLSQARRDIDAAEHDITGLDAAVERVNTRIDNIPVGADLTQAHLDAINSKFDGVLLNILPAQQLITNLNSAPRTLAQSIDNPSFDAIPLPEVTLSDYDRFEIELDILNIAGTETIESTTVAFSYDAWNALKELPVPTSRALQDATIQDNRALRFAWIDKIIPATNFSGNIQQVRGDLNTMEDNIRGSIHIIYVGKSNVANNPMLITISGIHSNLYLAKVRGYRGA